MDEFEFFFEKPWSDGLPVVAPTEERIARMLGGTSRSPDEVLGVIPPAFEEATVHSAAINDVMAGCKPEHLPVVVAGIEAIADERLNTNAVQATMRGVAPLMIVNGPYAREIGLHGGSGCFGPGFRANATIGRAIRLILYNLGGGIPGVASATCFGEPCRYSYCIAENEEESPWELLSVTKGFGPEENVLTAIVCESPHLVWDDVSQDPERLFIAIGDMMSSLGSANIYRRCDIVVALSPQHARLCADAGLSKADVHMRLCQTAGRRVGDIKNAGIWDHDPKLERLPFPASPEDDGFFVPAVCHPEDLTLIVAGGWPGPCTVVMPGMHVSSRPVSKKIEV